MFKKIIYFGAFLLAGISAFAQQHRDITLPEEPIRAKYVDYTNNQAGWWCAVQANGGIAATNEAAYSIIAQLDIINGYRFSEFFKIGIGFSPRFYFPQPGFPVTDTPRILNVYSVPVYLDVRGNFISQEDRAFAPYWNIDVGYAYGEGLFLSPCVGMRFGGIRNNFIVGISYTVQDHYGGDFRGLLHIFGLRVGYEF